MRILLASIFTDMVCYTVLIQKHEKKAKAIIEFRENNGPFKQPEDLINVPGIGPKTFEANKNRIIVE